MSLPTVVSGLMSGAGLGVGAGLATVVGWPAARALGRLITGTFDIGQAYIERPAALVRAKTEELVKDRQELAALARAAGLPDEDRAQRAMLRHLQAEDRRQDNIEAVAQKAFDDLSANPPEGEAVVSEEFMTAFEPLAESASTEDARILFAKVLAGEVRKPGSYSKRALNFLNHMDSDQASEIEKWAGLAWGGLDGPAMLPGGGPFDRGLHLYSSRMVESYGLIATGVMSPLPPPAGQRATILQLKTCVLLLADLPERVQITPLTPLGKEIFKLIWRAPTEDDLETYKNWAIDAGASQIVVQQIVHDDTGPKVASDARVLWRRP